MDINLFKDDDLFCQCKNKTKKEIIQIIKENDIHDLITLRKVGDVGNKCGGCGEDLENLIKFVWEN